MSKDSKAKAVDGDAEAHLADQSADLPKREVFTRQPQGSHPAQPDGLPTAEPPAEPGDVLPFAGDAAAKEAEADALPTNTQAKRKKRKRQGSDNPGAECEAEAAAASAAQPGSSKKKKKKKKSSKVWPFSRVQCDRMALQYLLDDASTAGSAFAPQAQVLEATFKS